VNLLPEAKSNKSFFGNSLLVFAIRFFPTLANLMVLVYYSRNLAPQFYGEYQNFWTRLYIITATACMGIHVFILTYKPDFLIQLLQKIKTKYYMGLVGWMVIASCVFECLQDSQLHAMQFVPFFFALTFSVSAIMESFLIVFRKFTFLMIVNILFSALFWWVHWQALHQTLQLSVLFLYLLLLVAGRMVVYCFVTVNNIRSYVITNNSSQDFSLSKIRSLWLHIGLYDVSQRVYSWMDKFIISFVLSKELSAIYFNGSQDIPFLSLILGAAGSVGLMFMASADDAHKKEYFINLMHHSSHILSAVVFPLFFFLFFFRYELFSTVLSDKYVQSVPVFFIFLFVVPLRAYSFTTLLQNQHKGAIINKGSMMDMVIALLLMYPLYKYFGLSGVALSYVISTYCQAGYYLYHTSKVIGVSILQLIPLKNWILKGIIYFLLFVGIHYVATLYFVGKSLLILGGIVFMATITISLLVELKWNKNNG
jgi:O-antigen/teichoic acid export membrane protein